MQVICCHDPVVMLKLGCCWMQRFVGFWRLNSFCAVPAPSTSRHPSVWVEVHWRPLAHLGILGCSPIELLCGMHQKRRTQNLCKLCKAFSESAALGLSLVPLQVFLRLAKTSQTQSGSTQRTQQLILSLELLLMSPKPFLLSVPATSDISVQVV